jgi:hypothetical protein
VPESEKKSLPQPLRVVTLETDWAVAELVRTDRARARRATANMEKTERLMGSPLVGIY